MATPLQQHIQKFLLKTGNAAGTFRISSRKPGNLAEWRDWQTPTLTDGPTPSPTASSSPCAFAFAEHVTNSFNESVAGRLYHDVA